MLCGLARQEQNFAGDCHAVVMVAVYDAVGALTISTTVACTKDGLIYLKARYATPVKRDNVTADKRIFLPAVKLPAVILPNRNARSMKQVPGQPAAKRLLKYYQDHQNSKAHPSGR